MYWCSSREVDPFSATGPIVPGFMCFLQHLAPSTIERYRTAIASKLRATAGIEVGNNSNINSLLAKFAQDKLVTVKASPAWDMSVALRMWSDNSFEP